VGKEARVFAELCVWTGEGKLLLETDELMFRGAKKLTIPLSSIDGMSIEDGWLVVKHGADEARFDLGTDYAVKWRHAIENPKQLIDKLDVKAGSRVHIAGPVDVAFIDSVTSRAAAVTVSDEPPSASDYDVVFVYVNEADELDSLTKYHPIIRSTGAIWVLHPKGRRETSHDAIMSIAKPLGLVDVKSAKFSETHGALKLMVPRAMRN
jgi:hypothetical protein